VSDLPFCSATELARRIRDRECSSVEAHLDRIARWNGEVNAVVTLDAEQARARAKAADHALSKGRRWGPLHGVPVTVKDQFATAGLRTTYGLPGYGNFIPDADAPLVARLRWAGAVLLGKTNLPMASCDWQCVHPTFGRGKNPWDRSRTPGGSSGGSAAALAAGFSPLELGGGLLSIAGTVGPSLSPPWAEYGALDAALPWFVPVFARFLPFVALTLALLLIAVVLHRAPQRSEHAVLSGLRPAVENDRVLAALGSAVGLGFVVAGIGPAETVTTWAVQGAVLGLFLAATAGLVWRYDRSLVPMMAAGFVGLCGVEAMVTASHSYAVPGELLALGLVFAVAMWWTRVLKRRQAA
jgi:hypothetical protein